MTVLGGAVLGGLRGLVRRAEQLVESAGGAAQSGVLAGEKLSRAVVAIRSIIDCVEQVEASSAVLRELGL